MSDEAGVKDRFDEVEGLRFYGIIRMKAEVRKKGVDPKYTDKVEITMERGFVAGDPEELASRAKGALDSILKEQKRALERR